MLSFKKIALLIFLMIFLTVMTVYAMWLGLQNEPIKNTYFDVNQKVFGEKIN